MKEVNVMGAFVMTTSGSLPGLVVVVSSFFSFLSFFIFLFLFLKKTLPLNLSSLDHLNTESKKAREAFGCVHFGTGGRPIRHADRQNVTGYGGFATVSHGP